MEVNQQGKLNNELPIKKKVAQLPSALGNFGEMREIFQNRSPLFFLDFDGTLSPIVENHQDACISEEMRNLVADLAKKYPVAVVSGRGLADVKERVGLPGLFYAGSHGFEIAGPGGFSKEQDAAKAVLPILDRIGPILKQELGEIPGVDFERKKFTLALHYRKVEASREQEVHQRVSTVLEGYPQLHKAGGKKVIEIRPAVDWHKGKAVAFLKRELSKEEDAFSVYIGDDLTDEDAFSYVRNGIGILVGDHGEQTYADYRLNNPGEVAAFFKALLST